MSTRQNGRIDSSTIEALPGAAQPQQLPSGADLVVEFLNTERIARGERVDVFRKDQDVAAWIGSQVALEIEGRVSIKEGLLLRSAQSLREKFRTFLNRVQTGVMVGPQSLSEELASASSYLRPVYQNGVWSVVRLYRVTSTETLLAPLVEAFVALVVSSELRQVRPCQASDCILWFRDKSRGNIKRFCSEKTCGTRARVAAHRAKHARSILGHE